MKNALDKIGIEDDDVAVSVGPSGCFEVAVDGKLLHSKLAGAGFPANYDTLAAQVKAALGGK